MDGSSIDKKNNIRDYYVNRIREKMDALEEIDEVDVYLYFNSLNNLDKKIYKEVKNKTKKDLLSLKLIVLKDKLKNKSSLDHLEYTSNYAITLLRENLINYKVLENYSKLCTSNYSVIDEGMYLEFARYCDKFNNMTSTLIEDIKNRPCNSSLITSLMSTEDLESHLRNNNDDLVRDMYKTVSKEKTLTK